MNPTIAMPAPTAPTACTGTVPGESTGGYIGIEMLGPVSAAQNLVRRVIQQELGFAVLHATSCAAYRGPIPRLVECGAEPMIAGCTDISLRTDPEEARVPLFDTTAIHAGAATACPLDDEP